MLFFLYIWVYPSTPSNELTGQPDLAYLRWTGHCNRIFYRRPGYDANHRRDPFRISVDQNRFALFMALRADLPGGQG